MHEALAGAVAPGTVVLDVSDNGSGAMPRPYWRHV
jgi:hypothetical protein